MINFHKCFGAFFFFFFCGAMLSNAADSATEAKSLLEKTKIKGGLCLVVGASSVSLTKALAGHCNLYVQMLEAHHKKAEAFGNSLVISKVREQVGVRLGAFNAEHYGSNLFNLIVIDDVKSLGGANLKDLYRLLTPLGFVAFKKKPLDFEKEAKNLSMVASDSVGYSFILQKPLTPNIWKLPVAKKWQGGPRSHTGSGFYGRTTGAGKLFYFERMELDQGDLKKSVARVFARDAYNGRILWSWEAKGLYSKEIGLAVTKDGLLFVRTPDRKVFQLDSSTGKVLLDLKAKVSRGTRIRMLTDDLLWVSGNIHSTKTGKLLWVFPSHRYQSLRPTIIGTSVYFCNGINVIAKNLLDGKDLWTRPLPKEIKPFWVMQRAGDSLLFRISTKGRIKDKCTIAVMNPVDGSIRWTYTMNKKEGYKGFKDGRVRIITVDENVLLYYRGNKPKGYDDQVTATKINILTGKVVIDNKVIAPAGDFHGCFREKNRGDYLMWYDLWLNKKTLEATLFRSPHPACFLGSEADFGMLYNFPSRKSGPISAYGHQKKRFEKSSAGKILKSFGKVSSSEMVKRNAWPLFRGNIAGGNSTKEDLGENLKKAWEVSLNLPGKIYGEMSGLRTGITQAVVGYGMAYVSDIDGQRIVALDLKDGSIKWVFAVGSRVDYSPAIYKGRCLFAAKNGWVYCVDAKTGALLWKLLAAPHQRLIGGWGKLESRWPVISSVLIANNIGYVGIEGTAGIAFNPETGEMVNSKDPGRMATGGIVRRGKVHIGGRQISLGHGNIIKGNSIPRTKEDNWHGIVMHRFKRVRDFRVAVFDSSLSVAFRFKPAGEAWANKGLLSISGMDKDPKKPLWVSPLKEMNVDDMVLTPKHVYCIGHYQRIKKSPEIIILSRQDGSVLKTIPFEGFPAFLGMSLSNGRLLIATREGKLVCYDVK